MNSENLDSTRGILEQDEGDQYLTFVLEDEEYAIDILKVHEIRGWTAVTPIPETPDYIQGVINMRGTIVPIVDLRVRFNLAHREYTATTVVIVVNLPSGNKNRVVGIIVDAVSDTYHIEEANIRPAPNMGGVIDLDYLIGLTTVNEKMVIILDIDRLLSIEELAQVAEVVDKQSK